MTAATRLRVGRILLAIGLTVQMLMGIAHAVAHLNDAARAATPPEYRVLMRQMADYPIVVGGVTRSMWDVHDGFSWFFATAPVCAGLTALMILIARRRDGGLLRIVAAGNLLFMGATLYIGLKQFPPPPNYFLAVSTGLLLLAAVLLPGGRGVCAAGATPARSQ